MRSILLGAAAALGLFPAMVSATVQLNVERVDVVPSGAAQTVFVEIFGVDIDNTNERLSAFTIGADAPRFTAAGVRFNGIQRPTAHPFIFGAFAGVEPEDFGSTFNRIQVGSGLSGSTQEANLVNGVNDGFVRMPIIVPTGTLPGFYPIVLDMSVVDLAGNAVVAVVPGTTIGGVNVVPEPASLGLIVLGGLLTLRRRRVA